MVKWIPNLPGFGEETCKKVARIATLAEGAKQLEVEMKADEPVRVGDILMGDYRKVDGQVVHSTPWWVEKVQYRWPENICKVQVREMKTDGQYLSTYRIYDKIVKHLRFQNFGCDAWSVGPWPMWRHDPHCSNANLGAQTLIIPEDRRLIFVDLEDMLVVSLRVPNYRGQPLVDPYGYIWLRVNVFAYLRLDPVTGDSTIFEFEKPIVVKQLREDAALIVTRAEAYVRDGKYYIMLVDYNGQIVKSIELHYCGSVHTAYPMYVDSNNQIHAFTMEADWYFKYGLLFVQKLNEQLEPIGELVQLTGYGSSPHFPHCFTESYNQPIGFFSYYDYGQWFQRYYLGEYNEPPQYIKENYFWTQDWTHWLSSVGNSYIGYFDYHYGFDEHVFGFKFFDFEGDEPKMYNLEWAQLGFDPNPSYGAVSTQSDRAIISLSHPVGPWYFRLLDITTMELTWFPLQSRWRPILGVHWISKNEFITVTWNEKNNTWDLYIYDIDGNLIKSGTVTGKGNLVGDTIVV